VNRSYRSAGAVVVSPDPANPLTLLLDQVRANGEHQTVAPKGTIEAGESPFACAIREVREETGITDLTYIAFLGQQGYSFTDRDGAPATKTVDWFLFAADILRVEPSAEEGFVAAHWLPFEEGTKLASHAEFTPYLDHANEIITWHQPSHLLYQRSLSELIWRTAREAAAILADRPDAGIGLCGSGARGDFVAGWSDVDLVGWGIPAESTTAGRLTQLVASADQDWEPHVSLRLANPDGNDSRIGSPVADMKLRSVLHRSHMDTAVLAGNPPKLTGQSDTPSDLITNLGALRDSAVRRLTITPTTTAERTDRTRRTLSVLCSGARLAVLTIDPDSSLRLPAVLPVLEQHWPNTTAARVLGDYDQLRQSGTVDLDQAEALAEQVPHALGGLRRATSQPAMADDAPPVD
jgi:8-oxo-dGTP pyrophosphatase MutT (NUDIX family)